MSRDRNTFAKRQREVEKKRKADEKRARRAQRGQTGSEASESTVSQSALSSAECAVLNVFRKCSMTPEKTLAFDRSNLDSYKTPLTQLASKGLLVEQDVPGTYSLTDSGFDAMKRGG